MHLNRQPGAVSPGAPSLRDLHPFRRRVLPIFVAALAAAVLTALLGFQSYRAAREAATERYALQQLSLARSIAAGLEAYFREVQTSLFSAATNPSLVRMTEDCPLVMEQMSLGFVPRTSIRSIDEQGILRFIHPSDDWRGTLIGTACDDGRFFQEARDTAQIVLSDVLINEKGQRRFRIAVPLFDTAEKAEAAFRGILAVSFDPRDIAQRFIKSEQTGGKAQTIVQKDGAMRICILDSVPIFAQDDRTLIATIVQGEDITDQKIAEETKKQLESQLLHAQKMEALGTLVAGVAHEINNPINKIMFDIPLLQKIWHDVIDDLGEGTDRAQTRKYGGLTVPFPRDNLPRLLADMEMAASRIVKTVANLKDFSRRSDSSVIVRISDNGRGIDPALWDTIFDPFVTSRQTDGGTGLGLSITYNLVQAHGGDISFYTNKEGGTTFRIAFPAMHS